MTPHQENTFLFCSYLPAAPLSPSRTLKGLFLTDTVPFIESLFMGPRLPLCVASGTTEIQGHHQVCPAGRGGYRTPSKKADANLDCAFVENELFFTHIIDFEK